MARTITLAFTGASGMPFGLRLLECLVAARCHVYLLYSPAAQIVAKQECALTIPTQPREAARMFGERFNAEVGQVEVFAREDWNAPIASGSSAADAMAICPCTVGTLGAIAAGLADNLIHRAADVMLKERRKLVLVPRETPLSSIHLEVLLKLRQAGALMLPAMPAFYTQPDPLADAIDFVAGKALDLLGVEHELLRRGGS